MVDVFLLLGSNIGNRQMFLQNAIDRIENLVGRVIKLSTIYETLAWGKTDQPDYLNQVLQVTTTMDAPTVLATILKIELDLGRVRKEKWGSRTIDIDILFYGSEIINLPNLIVPHPHLHNRKFALAPLAEIAPGFVHPIIGQSVKDLNDRLGL